MPFFLEPHALARWLCSSHLLCVLKVPWCIRGSNFESKAWGMGVESVVKACGFCGYQACSEYMGKPYFRASPHAMPLRLTKPSRGGVIGTMGHPWLEFREQCMGYGCLKCGKHADLAPKRVFIEGGCFAHSTSVPSIHVTQPTSIWIAQSCWTRVWKGLASVHPLAPWLWLEGWTGQLPGS